MCGHSYLNEEKRGVSPKPLVEDIHKCTGRNQGGRISFVAGAPMTSSCDINRKINYTAESLCGLSLCAFRTFKGCCNTCIKQKTSKRLRTV